jgi:kynurenine formamidase
MQMKIIDLSVQLAANMPVFPGDAPVEINQSRELQKDGFNTFHLSLDMHAGTHIDGPMHMTNSRKTIGDFPLDRFYGKGQIINVENMEVIAYQESYDIIIEDGSIVLLHTGFGKIFGTGRYFRDHPVIDEGLARFFVKKNVKMIGIDSPTIDKAPYPAHKILLGRNILIAENLVNLDQLLGVQNFDVIAFPLNIRGDSSPARIAALVRDE